MHLLLCAEDSEAELRSELASSFAGAVVRPAHPNLLEAEFEIVAGQRLPLLAFSRQVMANARLVRTESVRAWATELFKAVASILPDDQPWSLHIEPHYGARKTHRIGARAWHSATRGAKASIQGPAGTSALTERASDGRTSLVRRSSPSPPLEERAGERRPLLTAIHEQENISERQSQVVDAAAGRQRCRLIRDALIELMQRKRRHLLRQLRREPVHFTENESLVQLLLTAPDSGFVSVAPAPLPFEQRQLISPFPKGDVPVASDKNAPSRAFAKLTEAEVRLGCAIQAGETCVDLGAAPGSWTYVAVCRNARVIAVDRSPLREDLMHSRHVEFQPGDAFRFRPAQPVDWLLCDVIAAPERTAELLLDWLRHGWCRHFVVTLKLSSGRESDAAAHGRAELASRLDRGSFDALAKLKQELPLLTSEVFLGRLCANKREVCVFGACRHRLSGNSPT